MSVVLDSWAILRYLEGAEPAAGRIADLLDAERPIMSWIDLGEVHYVLRRSHGEPVALEAVRDLRDVIEPHLPDVPTVLEAARIKADRPMAYADAFGAALAIARGADLWTGDPELLIDEAPWRWVDLRAIS